MRNPIYILRYISIVLALGMFITSGCSTVNTGNMPPDFIFILDARGAGSKTGQRVNIRIDSHGEGRYERYNPWGSIDMDENNVVTYKREQVVDAGRFKLHNDEVGQLWNAVNENNFFALTGDYRMQIGSSYAFIMIEAGGRIHQVFNIGMEVPEIRAIVEAANKVLPEGIKLDYGVGYILKK